MKQNEAFGFYLENDSRFIGGPGSDQAYTSGFKFSYIYAENQIPSWSKYLINYSQFLDQEIKKTKVNFGFSLAQQIYTPRNTILTTLQPQDRPYASWLYLGFAVSLKEEYVAQFLELDIGMVGPSALGEQVQNNFHDLIHEPHAEGWSNGLNDEPTLQLFYQKRFKSYKSHYFDFFPYYGAGFGNVQIGAHVGSLIRFGIDLPNDFGPSRPSAGDGDSFVTPIANPSLRNKSYYIFTGIRGNALARNIFLDGNTFQASPHVKKYPFTFDTEFGLGAQTVSFSIIWRFVVRSPEFEQQSIFNSFASLNFIYFF